MATILEAILIRRAIKVFDPVEISRQTRDQILHAARVAPSSFNIQPYRLYWIESPELRKNAARWTKGYGRNSSRAKLPRCCVCWRR